MSLQLQMPFCGTTDVHQGSPMQPHLQQPASQQPQPAYCALTCKVSSLIVLVIKLPAILAATLMPQFFNCISHALVTSQS